jgi:anti-sigma-K factor RskA
MSDDLSGRAAEYVLGTLDAEEREDFARRLATDEIAASLVRDWQRRLSPIALACARPLEPAPSLWSKIGERIAAMATTGSVTQLRRSVARWRTATVLSGALAASLAIFVGADLAHWRSQSGPSGPRIASSDVQPLRQVAVSEQTPSSSGVQTSAGNVASTSAEISRGSSVVAASGSRDNAGGIVLGGGAISFPQASLEPRDTSIYAAAVTPVGAPAGLIVRVDPAARTIFVRRISADAPAGKTLELWWTVPGQPARDLGPIAGETARLQMPPDMPVDGAILVASLESGDRAPTQPTEPLLYQGKLVRN